MSLTFFLFFPFGQPLFLFCRKRKMTDFLLSIFAVCLGLDIWNDIKLTALLAMIKLMAIHPKRTFLSDEYVLKKICIFTPAFKLNTIVN